MVGFLLRYGVLFPARLCLLCVGLGFMVVSTAAVGYLPDGESVPLRFQRRSSQSTSPLLKDEASGERECDAD